jgi:hypothetical protein
MSLRDLLDLHFEDFIRRLFVKKRKRKKKEHETSSKSRVVAFDFFFCI